MGKTLFRISTDGVKVCFLLGGDSGHVDSGYVFGLGSIGRHLHAKPSKNVVKRCYSY